MFNNNLRLGFGNYFIQFTFRYYWQILLRVGYRGYGISKSKGFFTRNYKYNCENHGITLTKEKKMFCIDCEKNTPHQLGYVNKNKINFCKKVKFCTICGKVYYYDWD